MDKVDDIVQDINILYNLTTSLATRLSYHQLILHIRSVMANLWDSLSYIRTVSMHTMDCVDAATTGTLSPHVLPIMDLNMMLSHIEGTLLPTLHLPVSLEDILHFYRYLCTHFLMDRNNSYSLQMCPFRTDYNSCQTTRFSPWIFLIYISQPIMTSIPNTLV